MYFETFVQMKKQLGQLDKWFEIAADHAKAKKFDPDLYMGFRLAPESVEFWLAKPFRRHERILCTRENGAWQEQWLFP